MDYYRVDARLLEKTPHVTMPMLKADPVLGKLSVVRRNLQAINGVRLPKHAYQALRALWTQK